MNRNGTQLLIPFPYQMNTLNPTPNNTGKITETLARINERMRKKMFNLLDETDWENSQPRRHAIIARKKCDNSQTMMENDGRLSHLDELHQNMYEDKEELTNQYQPKWKD